MEFLDVIRPLYVLNNIFCVPKFCIRDNTAHTIGLKQICVTLIANCIVIYLFCTTFHVTEFKDFSLKVYYVGIYGQHIFSFVIISCNHMRLRNIYFALIKKLEQIYCFESHLLSPYILRRRLRISCGVLLYLYIGVIIPKLVLDPYWNWCRAVFLGLTIVIDLEMIFIIFVVRLLAFKMKSWSKVAEKLPNETNVDNNEVNADNRVTAHLNSSTDEQYVIEQYQENEAVHDEAKELFAVFKQLVDCTDLVKEAFQFTIFFHAFTIFTQSIVYIGVLILWIKQAEFDKQIEESVLLSHSTAIVVWIAKALVLQACGACASERLYAAVRAARAAACELVAGRQDLPTRRSAKNTLRVSALRLGPLAACALRVDAGLPLRLAALVAQYTVVLLQFALL